MIKIGKVLNEKEKENLNEACIKIIGALKLENKKNINTAFSLNILSIILGSIIYDSFEYEQTESICNELRDLILSHINTLKKDIPIDNFIH